MNKTTLIVLLVVAFTTLHAQDVNVTLKEAANFEKQQNETDALKKYQEVLTLDKTNITALVKCAAINCAIGARQVDKTGKTNFFSQAQTYAQKAYDADSLNAEADYAMALVAAKMTEVADDNKAILAWVRLTRNYVGKALTINPAHARANYILGKWNFDMVNLAWAKKAAVKALYGGLPKGDIDSAIFYMEKSRTLDPYFIQNYLDLAKAYQYINRPAQELEVLNKLVRLPIRTPDDPALKQEGQKMLDNMK